MFLRFNFDSNSFRSTLFLVIALAAPTLFPSRSLATSNFQQEQAFVQQSSLKHHHVNNVLASTPKVSQATLNLVKQYEGFRSNAYMDTNGLPVIGYGQSKINGKRVNLGQFISPAKADAYLQQELAHIQLLVLSQVKVPLTWLTDKTQQA